MCLHGASRAVGGASLLALPVGCTTTAVPDTASDNNRCVAKMKSTPPPRPGAPGPIVPRPDPQLLAFPLSAHQSMPWAHQTMMSPIVTALGALAATPALTTQDISSTASGTGAAAATDLALTIGAVLWVAGLGSLMGLCATSYHSERHAGTMAVKVRTGRPLAPESWFTPGRCSRPPAARGCWPVVPGDHMPGASDELALLPVTAVDARAFAP